MTYGKTVYSQITETEFEAAKAVPGTERIADRHPVGGLYSYNYRCADGSIVEKRTSDCAPTEYFRHTIVRVEG